MTHQGILLINTGSPDSPSVLDVRRYLREFLMDGRVIDIPFVARAALVYGCILPFRPKRSAAAYRKIWTEQGSPLVVTSQELSLKLQAASGLPVELSMRYGNPSVETALTALVERGVRRALVFPMFPHYAMSSYESAVVNVREIARRRFPGLRLALVLPYFDDDRYIESLADSAAAHLAEDHDHLLFSFHGMPVRHLDKADPQCEFGAGPDRERRTCYRFQSLATMRALLDRLSWPEARASIAYQSRLGQDHWLEPYTDRELKRLAGAGVRKLAVMCPSFTVDCLETLEEIAERGRSTFLRAGGGEFTMIPALNACQKWIDAMCLIAGEAISCAWPSQIGAGKL
jgi:protoporphyrin/coproporphyrin ferrochelatase